MKTLVRGVSVKHKLHSDARNIDYSKQYIKKLKKLFKKHPLRFFIVLDLHTRYEKSRVVEIEKI